LEKNYTLSYSFNNSKWVSLHDYFPSLSIQDRNNLYFIDNFYKIDANCLPYNALYKANEPKTQGKYFKGLIYTSFIDIINTAKATIKNILEMIMWQTSIYNPNDNVYNELDTIDQIMIYTDNQCSGLIDVSNTANIWYDNSICRLIDGQWYFNNFIDIVGNSELEILDIDKQPIISNVDNSLNNWWEQSEFNNPFFIIRLLYKNLLFGTSSTYQKKLYINNLEIKSRQSYR